MSSTSSTTYLGNFLKFLPTGTVFVFQTLNSAATNSGHCQPLHKYLSGFLFGICLLFCFFTSFTDSYTDENKKRKYVVVMPDHLIPTPPANADISVISPFGRADIFHAAMASVVFAVLGLMDTNTVLCFYPEYESIKRALLQILPPVALAIPFVACTCFPYNRLGIGYLPAESTSTSTATPPPPPPSDIELSQNNTTTPTPVPVPAPTTPSTPPPV